VQRNPFAKLTLFQPLLRQPGVFHDFITLVPTHSSRRSGRLSAPKLLSQEDIVQRPALTEWPIWHDDPWNDQQGYGALQRHDIALARYLAKQHAHRESVVHRVYLWAVVTRVVMLVIGAGRAFSSWHGGYPTEMSARQAVPPATVPWHRSSH